MHWQDFIAGYIAGMASLAVGHPLDTVKVRQQNLHLSFIDTIRRSCSRRSCRSLFQGLKLPMMMTGPSNAIFFGFYGNLLRWSQSNKTDKILLVDDPNWRRKVFWSGLTAGGVQVLIMCPVELVKVKLQSQADLHFVWQQRDCDVVRYNGAWDCFKKITGRRGFRGLYRGLAPYMWRDGPTSGVYTLTYELLTVCESPYTETCKAPLVVRVFAGGLAGVLSYLLVVPFDFVKNRIQGDSTMHPHFSGTIDCFRKTYNKGGIKLFFRGSVATICRIFPTNAICFVVYEYTTHILRGSKDISDM